LVTRFPSIADHQVHRYDLMKSKMISTHPIDDLAEAIRVTLVSGNRVWFVGGLNLPTPEKGPWPAASSRIAIQMGQQGLDSFLVAAA